jgi:hypothetical protein
MREGEARGELNCTFSCVRWLVTPEITVYSPPERVVGMQIIGIFKGRAGKLAVLGPRCGNFIRSAWVLTVFARAWTC